MQAKAGRADGDDEVEWQAGEPDQVVRIEPEAFDIGTDAQHQQVLDQRWQQDDHAGHQRQRIQQCHDADDRLGQRQRQRQAAVAVDLIDECAGRPGLLEGAVHLPALVQGDPPACTVPVGVADVAVPGLPGTEDERGRSDGGVARAEERLAERIEGRHGNLLRCGTRFCPVADFGLEHGKGPGVKGDEQHYPADDADPGMHHFIGAHDGWLHGAAPACDNNQYSAAATPLAASSQRQQARRVGIRNTSDRAMSHSG